MNLIKKKISTATSTQLDGIWITLRSDIGILRKLAIICELLDISVVEVMKEAPQENGRILDKKTRELIHEYLLPAKRKKKRLTND